MPVIALTGLPDVAAAAAEAGQPLLDANCGGEPGAHVEERGPA